MQLRSAVIILKCAIKNNKINATGCTPDAEILRKQDKGKLCIIIFKSVNGNFLVRRS
jgi:hypothetical protein